MSDQNILSEIRERLVRVETKIDTMTDIKETAEKAEDTAKDALSRAASVHKRIDKIDKAVFWLVTTVIGAVILAVLGIIFGGGIVSG